MIQVDDIAAKRDRVTILTGVTLTVAPGEIVTVLGPSGSGKTTLLRTLLALEPRAAGRVQFGERSLDLPVASLSNAAFDLRRNVSAFFGVEGLRPYERGSDRLRRIRLTPGGTLGHADVEGLAERLGLLELLKRHPHRLSTGQRARLGLLSALIVKRPALLLDEFASNLDNETQRIIFETLRSENSARATLLASHARELAFEFSDQVHVIDGNRLERVK